MTDTLKDPAAQKSVSPSLQSPLVTEGIPSVEIREAVPSDLDWLVGQAREFSHFNATVYPLFDDEVQVRESLSGLIHDHFMRVAWRGGQRLGFICGYYVRHPLNPKVITLCEIMWWVSVEHRHSSAGLRLLDTYIAWGRAHANWITFSLQTHSPVKQETLTRRGFHMHESGFLLEVI